MPIRRCPKCHGRKMIRLWYNKKHKTKDKYPCPACGGKGTITNITGRR